MLTGGYGDGHVSRNSVELYPPSNCSPPPLPFYLYDHFTFLTQSNLLATCTAWYNSGAISCLALNTTSQQWQNDTRLPGSLQIGGSNHGNVAITVPDIGVYLFGKFQDPTSESEPSRLVISSIVLLRPGATSGSPARLCRTGHNPTVSLAPALFTCRGRARSWSFTKASKSGSTG